MEKYVQIHAKKQTNKQTSRGPWHAILYPPQKKTKKRGGLTKSIRRN